MNKTYTVFIGIAAISIAALAYWYISVGAEGGDSSLSSKPQPTNKIEAQRNLRVEGIGEATSSAAERVSVTPVPTRLPQAPEVQANISKQEILVAEKVHARASVESFFGAFFTEANLSPATVSRLKDLLAEGAMATRQIGEDIALRRARGEKVDRAEYQAALAESRLKEESSLRELLGPKVVEDFKKYTETAPLRPITNELASRLAHTGKPLSTKDASALVRILAESGDARITNPTQVNWQEAEKKAAAILTQDQMEQFREIRDLYNVKVIIQEARETPSR